MAGNDYDPDDAVLEDDGDEEGYEKVWNVDEDEGAWDDADLIDEDDPDDEEE